MVLKLTSALVQTTTLQLTTSFVNEYTYQLKYTYKIYQLSQNLVILFSIANQTEILTKNLLFKLLNNVMH